MHRYSTSVVDTALAAATKETVIQVATPSTRKARILEWSVSFDGVTATAEPVVVRIVRQTGAGTASAAVENPMDPDFPAALCTTQTLFTVEPTSDDFFLEAYNVHPQGGLVLKQYPQGQEIIMDISQFLGITCTAPAVVNVCASISWEE